MNFNFEYHHLAMDSREKIQAMKIIERLHPDLLEIVIGEVKSGNVVTRAQEFGEGELEVVFQNPFNSQYSRPNLQHLIETDPHYHGDFYRIGPHAVVAPLS